MAQRPSNLPLFIIIPVAVAALIGISVLQHDSDPAIVQEKQKEAERKAQEAQSKAATPAPEAAPAPGADEVATWGAKKTWGKPGGKPAITVTWEWTPAVQGDPSTVFAAVETIKKTFPDAEVTAINKDAAGSTAQSGIALDGVIRLPASPDGTFLPEAAIAGSLKAATSVK